MSTIADRLNEIDIYRYSAMFFGVYNELRLHVVGEP